MPELRPDICVKIRDRIDKWEKYWTINRSLYYEWVDFIMGDQWREDESKLFERYNKIPLIFNKLGVLMNNLISDQMQNTPNLQIQPDENVPAETAEVRAALIKNISLNSDAKRIYQNSFWQSVVGGYGAYAIGHRYLSNLSFDQEPYFMDFYDPNNCYWDISAQHVCKVDGRYAGFKTRLSREMFRNKWGKDVESNIGTYSSTEDSTIAFADDDSITQIDDFERVAEKGFVYQLSDDSVVDDIEFKKLKKEKIASKRYIIKDGRPVTVTDKREITRFVVTHRQIAGDYVLEETEFPSELLPVVYVDQKSYYSKSGQQITRSFFKDAKDPQKYLNYLATQSAYLMKISRYDQFIMPRKCAAFPDTQQQWRDPSVVRGALYYDETPSGAKPEQLRPPELSASLTNEYQRTLMDIQSSTGMYDTQMGDQGNEISGTAIDARTERGSKNTYVPYNSLNIAITTGGEIINQMIPKLYDRARKLVLSTAESDSKRIEINSASDPYGLHVKNDMTKGQYSIRLKAGPSYEGEKELGRQSLESIINNDRSGQAFNMLADLYAENLPLDNNIEIRNRLRTMVSPQIIKAGKTGEPIPPQPPQPDPMMLEMQLKQQELQMKQQNAQAEYQLKMKDLELKQGELQRKALETHQDMTMGFAKLEADKEQAAANLQETLLRYQAESNRIGADIEMQHSDNLVKILTHHPKHLDKRT